MWQLFCVHADLIYILLVLITISDLNVSFKVISLRLSILFLEITLKKYIPKNLPCLVIIVGDFFLLSLFEKRR